MKSPRIAPPYKVFAVRANGQREPLDTLAIIVQLRPGIEVEIDFAPNPKFAGDLIIFTPPTRHMERLYKEGKVDSFAVVFGAENVVHVKVERRIRRRQDTPTRRATRRPSAKLVEG